MFFECLKCLIPLKTNPVMRVVQGMTGSTSHVVSYFHIVSLSFLDGITKCVFFHHPNVCWFCTPFPSISTFFFPTCLKYVSPFPNHSQHFAKIQWVDLREDLQKTIDLPMTYGGFLHVFPFNQSSERWSTYQCVLKCSTGFLQPNVQVIAREVHPRAQGFSENHSFWIGFPWGFSRFHDVSIKAPSRIP